MGLLHLIDLPTWTDRVTGVQFDGWAPALAFHPEGGSLYWFRSRELHRFDLATGTASLVGKLPHYFQFSEMRILPSGSRVALFGISCRGELPCVRRPHVVVVFDNLKLSHF